MEYIQVTEEILQLELEPLDGCGCYLHRAIQDHYDYFINPIVGLHTIELGEDNHPDVSEGLRNWQQDFIEYAGFHHDDRPGPITVVYDEENNIMYIEGEEL